MSFSSSYYYNDDNHNPNSATPQEEEEDENSLFLSDTAADQSTQQPNFGRISDKPLLEISKDISRNTPPTQQKDSTTKRRYSSTTRKSGKKDRHSKIHTAQGFRDRRMRLSLEIARKFFDLQDMLGFDKASNTIDWLFSQSESAIRKLSCSNPQLNNDDNMSDHMFLEREEKSEKASRKIVTEGESCDSVGKLISEESITKGYKDITKELRAKARARARERTREKMLMRSLEKSKDNNCKFAHQLGPEGNPNSLFEAGQESTSNSTTQDHEHISTNVENLMSSATESPSRSAASCYGYDELFSSGGLDFYSNYNLSFLGNWDILLKHGPDLDSRTPNSNLLGNSSCYHYMQ